MSEDPGIAGLGSVLASLLCILLLLAAAAFVLKRWRGGNFQKKFLRNDINILSSRQIGWQSSLLIVEAQGRRFLIGAGRHGVTAIGALDTAPAPTMPPQPGITI